MSSRASSLSGRWIPIVIALVLGGCDVPSSSFQVQPATPAGVTAEQALARVFNPLDQQSTTVDPMAKGILGPVADGALDARMVALRRRLEQRLGAMDSLRADGAVGENSRGYLEARGNITSEQEELRSDENADRREIYSALAMQMKDNVEQVGRLRAQKIAIYVVRGVWLQGADGTWYQKQ